MTNTGFGKVVKGSWKAWKILAVAAPTVIVGAVLDYLVITRGLLLLPPLGSFLQPGFGLWTALEVYVIDAIIMGVALWLLGFGARRASAIIASALVFVFIISTYAAAVIDTMIIFGTIPLAFALRLLIITMVGMTIGFIGTSFFIGIASKEYDP